MLPLVRVFLMTCSLAVLPRLSSLLSLSEIWGDAVLDLRGLLPKIRPRNSGGRPHEQVIVSHI
jgi:hypothetical protein